MAEQILHGSNVVTAAEQGRRERVAEGVRCGGLRDACLFYGTFEGALKGLVIHVMATHDTAPWIGRMRVLRKTQNHGGNARRADTSAQGRREAQRRCGPRPGPSATMPVHATAARAGWVPSSRVTSRPDPGALALPHDDRAVIEIQILTRSCKPSLIRMPVPYRSWANKRCSPSRKPRMRTTSSGVSTTGKRRDGRGLPIS